MSETTYNVIDPSSGTSLTQINHIENIEGLVYVKGAITMADQCNLLQHIETGTWVKETTGRDIQQYGRGFNYRTKLAVDEAPPLPQWLAPVIKKLDALDLTPAGGFDQVIINKYVAGTGIAFHCDSKKAFLDTIVSISLGCPVYMQFQPNDPAKRKNNKPKNVWLEVGSVLCMKGPARNDWQHRINARRTDVHSGITRTRGTRISITLRKLVSVPK